MVQVLLVLLLLVLLLKSFCSNHHTRPARFLRYTAQWMAATEPPHRRSSGNTSARGLDPSWPSWREDPPSTQSGFRTAVLQSLES
jgi:hypothetical protein